MRPDQNNKLNGLPACRQQQLGIAIPLVVVGLLALLAMAGLSLDTSHALANKTRLQNTVDAAALSAAKVLDSAGTVADATAEALATFGRNSDAAGNHELDDAYDASEITIQVQYSATLNPFVPGSPNGPYVRVIATGFDIQTTLARVLNIDEIPVAASAVAGPSPTIDYACDIAPLLVCADDVDAEYYGFDQDELKVLKPGPSNHGDVGPGNYKLLDIPCEDGPGGGACVRENFAGGYEGCFSDDDTADTKPGVTQGPTLQGFNVRFAEYNGPIDPEDYPPDVVTQTPENCLACAENYELVSDDDSEGVYKGSVAPENAVLYGQDINYSYTEYMSAVEYGPHDEPDGVPYRRVMTMPVADCSGDDNGKSTMDIEGFACYFMLQPVRTNGESAKMIFGQFVEGCLAGGNPGPNPGAGPGPYVIQLYKDPDSGDS